jgi:hypothetical protein
MTRPSTTALILPSPTVLAPWGDPGWRVGGCIQYVSEGPDFLWADVGVPDRPEGEQPGRAMMSVREAPADAAADIAVMVLAVMDVPNWEKSLDGWWKDESARPRLTSGLTKLLEEVRDDFKLAIVHTPEGRSTGLSTETLRELEGLGFKVEEFTPR